MRVITEILLPTPLKRPTDQGREADLKSPQTLISGNSPLPFASPPQSSENAGSECAAPKAEPQPGIREENPVALGHDAESSMHRSGSGSSDRAAPRFPNRFRGRESSTSVTLRRVQIVLVLFLFWVLAIVLPDVHFAPGNRTVLQEGLRGDHSSVEILMDIFFSAVTFIGLTGLLLWAFWKALRRKKKHDDEYQIYHEPIPTPWSVYLIMVLLLAAVAGLFWWAWQPASMLERRETPFYSQTPAGDREKKGLPAALPSALPPHEPQSREWVVIPIAALLAVGLGVTLWRLLTRQPEKERLEGADVSRMVAQAVSDLEKGEELSDIVLRCYREMYRILGRKATLRREMTAREFVRQLDQVGVRGEEIESLTKLFERVRYGRLGTGPAERAEAIALLKAIETRYGKGSDEA